MGPTTKMFQITEDDLADLERIMPRIADEMMVHLTARTKIGLRRIQKILSDVRWNYGPPGEVEVIQCDPD